jgi:hypothetical protein
MYIFLEVLLKMTVYFPSGPVVQAITSAVLNNGS